MQISIKKINLFLIWIFPLISYQFFQFNMIEKNIVIVFSVLFYTLIILYCLKYILSSYKETLITKYKYLFLWILVGGLLCPLLFWGQNIFLSFRISIEIYRYIFFFLLIKAAISEKQLLKVIDFYFILYFALEIAYISFNLYGYFGYNEGIIPDETRGLLRPRIQGLEFGILSFFLHLNNYLQNKKFKDLLFVILAITSIFLSLTRQVIFFSTIVGLLFVLRSSKYKIIITIAIGLFMFFVPNLLMNSKLPIIKDMIVLSQSQIESNNNGNKDIRLVEAEYFLFNFNESVPQIIFGNGQPHGYSNYGKKIIKLSENEDLYTNDIGYVQLFIGFGIIGIFLFFLFFYKLFKYKVNSNYIWCKYFILNLLLLNIASQSLFLSGMSISIVTYLMIISRSK